MIATGNEDVYVVEPKDKDGMIRIREKRAYGWMRCFTEDEALELVMKLADELGLRVEE